MAVVVTSIGLSTGALRLVKRYLDESSLAMLSPALENEPALLALLVA